MTVKFGPAPCLGVFKGCIDEICSKSFLLHAWVFLKDV